MTPILRAVRLANAAMAFHALARSPDALTVGAEVVTDAEVEAIESGLARMVGKLRADPSVTPGHELGAALDDWLVSSALPVPPRTANGSTGFARRIRPDRPRFNWKKRTDGGLTVYETEHAGHMLRVVRAGPASYDATLDGRPVTHSKFRKSARERLEKEAVKFAA